VGPEGPQGPSGTSGYQIISQTFTLAAGASAWYDTICPTGKKAIGGGGRSTQFPNGLYLNGSFPIADGAGWRVEVTSRITGQTNNGLAYAICAFVG
jgi:hypothetical protein